MPRKDADEHFTPIPGAQYEVLVTKLGADDEWGAFGEVYLATDYPAIDFAYLASRKAVRRIDQPEPAAEADPNVTVEAQPHREFTSDAPDADADVPTKKRK